MSQRLLFSVAGARGIVGKTIDAAVVTKLSLAFSSVLPEGPIVIGRDTRPSGESFLKAAVAAITGCGRDIIDVGVATTPTVEMVTELSAAAGGIIVTASHNPIEWNALKFLDHRGIFITSEVGGQLFAAYESGNLETAGGQATGSVQEYNTASEEHINAILALAAIDQPKIETRRFKVVLDCINGAGSVIAPDLLERLGCEVICINCKTDGDFFRDPEPRPDNLQELADRVQAENADIGFATDPDGDRLALVDNNGRAISEEYTLALAVDHILTSTPAPVVVNMSTSAVVDAVAARHGVEVHRTPVGEAHVVARMLETGAIIGGEGNGGVIYPTLHPGRDAPLGMALILQLLQSCNCSLADKIREYPSFHITKAKMPLDGEFSAERISGLLKDLGPDRIDTQDGVKAVFSDGWIHLRVSNTEGVVRAIVEAPDESRSLAWQKQARDIVTASWGKR